MKKGVWAISLKHLFDDITLFYGKTLELKPF